MRLMGLEAIYLRPKTSRPHPDHKVYPYLLRALTIDHPNQVCAADITYIPMQRVSMYLVAVMDWYSRKVLSWRLSNTQKPTFALKPPKRQSGGMGPLRSSTQTRDLSSPAGSSRICSKTTTSPSAWTVVGEFKTTYSLRDFGGRLSITIYISYLSRRALTCAGASRNGSSCTTKRAFTRPLTT